MTTTAPRRGGHPQLWQFLVSLLDDPRAGCIAWTGRGAEFKLVEPEEVVNYTNLPLTRM